MKRNAFTLIEMVVVILILGIMAAVAAPRMFSTADKAAANATRSQLNVLRNAIELYATRNEGAYPLPTTDDTLGDLLVDYINGEFPSPQVGATKDLDSVLTITGVDTDPADSVTGADHGWVYNSDNGKIVVNDNSYKAW